MNSGGKIGVRNSWVQFWPSSSQQTVGEDKLATLKAGELPSAYRARLNLGAEGPADAATSSEWVWHEWMDGWMDERKTGKHEGKGRRKEGR